MASFTNFAQTGMSKNDTSLPAGIELLKARFGHISLHSKLALKCALRRLSENLVWGRMGLVFRRRASGAGPCASPCILAPSENFSPSSNPLKLSSRSIF